MTQEIKKAIESAEQEIQEKEVAQLKSIIKDLLEKKVDAEKDKREIEKKISIIKQTIDDFKAGRLDKVKELIEKDSEAETLLPFKIIIINQPVITQPWNWQYTIQPISYYPTYPTVTCTSTTLGGSSTYTSIGAGQATTCYTNATQCGGGVGYTGNNYATLTAGTYSLNSGNTISL